MAYTKEQRELKVLAEANRIAQRLPERRFFFMEDDYASSFRVWREGDPGDCFDVIPYNTPAIGDDHEHSKTERLAVKTFIEKLCTARPGTFVYGDPEDEVGK